LAADPLSTAVSFTGGTDGSNPSSSSGESANFRSLSTGRYPTDEFAIKPGVLRGTEGAPENVRHGDTIDIEITGIGTLSNPVVRNGQ
jgi:2-keto-4-pentenoate hydratase/2-oxohepta-3-ene-1,7-dioic acid hydratase in catechol pathway